MGVPEPTTKKILEDILVQKGDFGAERDRTHGQEEISLYKDYGFWLGRPVS